LRYFLSLNDFKNGFVEKYEDGIVVMFFVSERSVEKAIRNDKELNEIYDFGTCFDLEGVCNIFGRETVHTNNIHNPTQQSSQNTITPLTS